MAEARRGSGNPLLLLANPRIQFVVGLVVALLLVLAAYKLRMLPYYNYEMVYQLAKSKGIEDKFARYSFLNANDPWIEYWLAKYLHEHGLGSWTTLTKNNPVTHKFWYPWGRDFTKTAYPLVPMLGSLGGDPLRSTVILPAIAGAVMVLAAYLAISVEYGPLAGILAALILAFLPAAASRTFAGFVEKTGIAMPVLIAVLGLYIAAVKRRSIALGVATGAVWSIISLMWGGYALAGLMIAATALLAPLSVRPRDAEKIAVVSLAASVTFAVLSIAYMSAGYGKVSRVFALMPILASIYAYLLIEEIFEARFGIIKTAYPEKTYTAIVVATIVAAAALSPFIGIGGKYAYTMFWPLRDIGLLHTGRIEQTVAEMASVFTGQNFRTFIYESNITAFFAPLAGIYLLYRALRRGEPQHLPLAAMSLGLFYGVLGMMYLLQAFATMGALAIAAATGLLTTEALAAYAESKRPQRKKRKKGATASRGGTAEELKLALSILAVLIILAGTAVAANYAVRTLSATAATVTGGSSRAIYLGWLGALQLLSHRTPSDAVVVSWWDYGYWITVGSDRATLADGATLNGTQIRLLAKAFTGTEEEANHILHMLHLKPGRTYVLFNDIVDYNVKTGTINYLFPRGGIDLMKSWAMHHIAGRDDKFNRILRDVVATLQGDRQAAADLIKMVNETFIFRVFASAPYHLKGYGIVIPQDFKPLLGSLNVKNVYIGAARMPDFKFKHFKPYAIIIAPYMTPNGRMIKAGDVVPALLIVIYQWTG